MSIERGQLTTDVYRSKPPTFHVPDILVRGAASWPNLVDDFSTEPLREIRMLGQLVNAVR